jgi:hypothetical protein
MAMAALEEGGDEVGGNSSDKAAVICPEDSNRGGSRKVKTRLHMSCTKVR